MTTYRETSSLSLPKKYLVRGLDSENVLDRRQRLVSVATMNSSHAVITVEVSASIHTQSIIVLKGGYLPRIIGPRRQRVLAPHALAHTPRSH